jgi:putative addiction module CopG family antidote
LIFSARFGIKVARVNVTLPIRLKRFVEREVKAGRFKNVSDATCEGLRLLEQRNELAASQSLLSLDFAGGDIIALVQLVMMQCAKTNADILRDIMEELKANNATKSKLRDLIAKVGYDIAENAGQQDDEPLLRFNPSGIGSESGYHSLPLPYPDVRSPGGFRVVPTDMHKGRITHVCVLRAIRDELKNRLDSMSDLGEMESLRMQMAMDRRSKCLSTLSNILKKSGESSAQIIANIK